MTENQFLTHKCLFANFRKNIYSYMYVYIYIYIYIITYIFILISIHIYIEILHQYFKSTTFMESRVCKEVTFRPSYRGSVNCKDQCNASLEIFFKKSYFFIFYLFYLIEILINLSHVTRINCHKKQGCQRVFNP